jgi:hypothetical protein
LRKAAIVLMARKKVRPVHSDLNIWLAIRYTNIGPKRLRYLPIPPLTTGYLIFRVAPPAVGARREICISNFLPPSLDARDDEAE